MSERHKNTLEQPHSSHWHYELVVGFVSTVVGHGEDGDLSDGAVTPFYSASSLIDGGQIRVHVTGETSPARHLLSGCGHLRCEWHTSEQTHNLFPIPG